jgi:DNA phosphorothioation-associated putative methyltransferase
MGNNPGGLRHKTALERKDLSRPVRQALRDGVLRSDHTVFDYGCGRGGDVRRLRRLGHKVSGWDPVHAPRGAPVASNVVNLGYVVNVIEDPVERTETLLKAWELAADVLVVSARLTHDQRRCQETEGYEDGVVTGMGTFQKFFTQSELSAWIAETLGTPGVPAAPGIIYVFREEAEKERFLVRRYGRRLSQPRQLISYERFEKNKLLLRPLSDFFSERGRLPQPEELANSEDIAAVFGSLPMAFDVIRRATDSSAWKEISAARRDDLLVYLALSRLSGRPVLSKLPSELQLDIRAHFGAYTRACAEADALLFSAGDKECVATACRESSVGKQTPTALYVHVDALPLLDPVLRVYEGCTRTFIGVIEDANILKLHRVKAQISYLCYPEFEKDPHPAAFDTTVVNLDDFRIFYRRYADSSNPPILHRKEEFVAPDHPDLAKFARLTAQEESKGLYEDSDSIGFRTHWEDLLHSKRLRLRGHRLCTIKATPSEEIDARDET